MSISPISERAEFDSPGVVIIPPIVFYACLIIGSTLEFIAPSAVPLIPRLIRIVLGIALGVSGFAFMIIAHEKFKHLGTNVHTNLPASTFVVQGAYRLSRNPMYVGGSFFFLGIGLAVGSLWILAAFIPLGLYLSLFVIPREEMYMERRFGEEYRAYRRQVRRWL